MAQAAPTAMPVPMPTALLLISVPSATPSAKAMAKPLLVSAIGVGLGEGVLSSGIACLWLSFAVCAWQPLDVCLPQFNAVLCQSLPGQAGPRGQKQWHYRHLGVVTHGCTRDGIVRVA